MGAPTNIQLLEHKLINGNLSREDWRLLIGAIKDVSKGIGYDGGAIPGSGGEGGGEGVWGQITGTLSAQTDLNNALGLKADITYVDIITNVSISGATTLTDTAFNKLHICTGTSVDYTIDLPTAVGNTGKSIAFKGASTLTRVVTIDGNGSQTIDGNLDIKLGSSGLVVLVSNGTNWDIVNEIGSWIPFTIGITGFSAAPTNVDATYYKIGKKYDIRISMTAGTSNATTMTITGLPCTVRANHIFPANITNNSAVTTGRGVVLAATSEITIQLETAGSLTASGTKGANIVTTLESQ